MNAPRRQARPEKLYPTSVPAKQSGMKSWKIGASKPLSDMNGEPLRKKNWKQKATRKNWKT